MVAERTRDKDLVYEIEPAIQDELLKHPGKWAAITRSEILAIRNTSTEAYLAAHKKGIAVPILYHVPDGHPRTYYY